MPTHPSLEHFRTEPTEPHCFGGPYNSKFSMRSMWRDSADFTELHGPQIWAQILGAAFDEEKHRSYGSCYSYFPLQLTILLLTFSLFLQHSRIVQKVVWLRCLRFPVDFPIVEQSQWTEAPHAVHAIWDPSVFVVPGVPLSAASEGSQHRGCSIYIYIYIYTFYHILKYYA